MTRFVVATTLVALLALPASSQQVQDDPLAGLEAKIGKAIDKGVEWLKKQQTKDGSWPPSSGPVYGGGGQNGHPNKLGNTALALLALLKSDVEPTDPVIQKGFTFMYGYTKQSANPASNYERAVTLMCIEALYQGMIDSKRRKEKKPPERLPEGKEPQYAIGGNDLAVAGNMLKEILKEQTKKGGWRYGGNFVVVGSDEDISATQIMLLGLKSATRMRLAVGDNVFDKAMKFIIDSQEKDGPKVERPSDMGGTPGGRGTYVSNGEDHARGWAYELKSDDKDDTRATGAMSCAGLGGLLICKSVIGKKLNKTANAKIEQSIFDGFAWVYSHWTVHENPFAQRSHYYYLYGIERVGTMGSYERIGKHIWFTEGAKYLVDAQEKDGKWDDKEVQPTAVYATSFALLFLKKGTVPIGDVITGDRYSGGGGTPAPQGTPVPQPTPTASGEPQPQPSGTPDPVPSPEPGK